MADLDGTWIQTGIKTMKLTCKGSRKLYDYFQKSTRIVVDWCVSYVADTLVIEYNVDWKQNSFYKNYKFIFD